MSLLVSFSIESRIISRKNDIFSFDFHLSSEKSKLYIHLSMTMAMALVMIHWPDMSIAHKITCNQSKLRSFSFSFFTSVKAIGSRTTPRLKTICCQVNKEEQNLMLYGQFSAPVKRGISKEEGGGGEVEEKQNYYVNMGYAIRTLREDFPQLFYREPTFHVYRDDIVFKDPLNTFIGIENYKSIFWALRFYGRIFFKALWVDLISVWQPVENVIMVRWTVHGIPRVPWESRGRFDGTSEYKLDKKGKIFEHRVDNVAPNTPPKFRVLSMEELIQYIGCPSTPRPTCFEKTSSTDRT